jgi:hypothetical protein
VCSTFAIRVLKVSVLAFVALSFSVISFAFTLPIGTIAGIIPGSNGVALTYYNWIKIILYMGM